MFYRRRKTRRVREVGNETKPYGVLGKRKIEEPGGSQSRPPQKIGPSGALLKELKKLRRYGKSDRWLLSRGD